MSWFIKALFIAFLVTASVFSILRFAPSIPISSTVTQKSDFFTVTGDGKVTVVPDTAIINLGITSQGSSVKLVQNQANTIINSVSRDVKALGVDSKDIQTSNYSIYPQYSYTNNVSQINGYQVSASLTITVRDFDKINSVIDKATADGANRVSGIELTVDEDKQKTLLQTARQDAIKDAKSKAESLASAAGLSLGRIINVSESGRSTPYPMMYANDMAGSAVAAPSTKIEAGSTDITASITLTYETR